MSDVCLKGARILVVEDEFIIALDLSATLTRAGAEIVGPVATLAEAQARAAVPDLSAAILDVRLGEDNVWTVVRALAERQVPVLFHTGHGSMKGLKSAWPGCEVLVKPAPERELLTALSAMLRRAIRQSD